MSRSTLIITCVVVLLFSAAIVGWSFFGLGTAPSPSQPTKQLTQLSQQKTSQNNDNTIIGPINSKNKYLKDTSINYNKSLKPTSIYYFLQGKLRETRTLPEGIELVTDITGEEIPLFILTDKTIIVFNTDGQQTPATTSDFTPNQEVGLNMLYDLNKKTWTTRKVHIFIKS